jgi:hypothetical protein
VEPREGEAVRCMEAFSLSFDTVQYLKFGSFGRLGWVFLVASLREIEIGLR